MVDATQIKDEADSFKLQVVGGNLENIQVEAPVGASVVLNARLVLVSENDVPDCRDEFVDVELRTTINIDGRWR